MSLRAILEQFKGTLANIVEDTTPQLGGFLDPNSKYIGWDKGGDIASASPLVIDIDGNYFDVTGTTGFSAMTVATNRLFMLQFDGALTMTHGASLNLPSGANITTAAGDEAMCFSTAANTVRVIGYIKADGTALANASNVALLNAVQAFTAAQRASQTALTSTSNSIAIDFADTNDYTHTFTENTTLANPSNVVVGQSGAIHFTQHASAPKTLAFGSNYDFTDAEAPTVTATNSARDTLYYHVRSATQIECSMKLNLS